MWQEGKPDLASSVDIYSVLQMADRVGQQQREKDAEESCNWSNHVALLHPAHDWERVRGRWTGRCLACLHERTRSSLGAWGDTQSSVAKSGGLSCWLVQRSWSGQWMRRIAAVSKIRKMETKFNTWRSRDMTLFGKTVCVRRVKFVSVSKFIIQLEVDKWRISPSSFLHNMMTRLCCFPPQIDTLV